MTNAQSKPQTQPCPKYNKFLLKIVKYNKEVQDLLIRSWELGENDEMCGCCDQQLGSECCEIYNKLEEWGVSDDEFIEIMTELEAASELAEAFGDDL